MGKRSVILGLGTLLVILGIYISTPGEGAGVTLAFVQQFTMPVIAVWFAHLARKVLFDYLDMEELFAKAKESATGAGLIFFSVCLVLFGLLTLFGSTVRA